jgi:hypothetical protein
MSANLRDAKTHAAIGAAACDTLVIRSFWKLPPL